MRQEFFEKSSVRPAGHLWFFNLFFKILLTNIDKKNLSKIRNERNGFRTLTKLFLCLHNKLSSFNSIIVQMSEKRDSSI